MWVSGKTILFFLLILPAGFMLTLAGTALQGRLFGFGISLWVVGVFGSVYSIVRRLWGPRAAKLAVLTLFVILLGELFSGKRNERDHDPFDRRN